MHKTNRQSLIMAENLRTVIGKVTKSWVDLISNPASENCFLTLTQLRLHSNGAKNSHLMPDPVSLEKWKKDKLKSSQAIINVFPPSIQIKLLKRAKTIYRHVRLELQQKPTKREAWTANSARSVSHYQCKCSRAAALFIIYTTRWQTLWLTAAMIPQRWAQRNTFISYETGWQGNYGL